MVWGTVWNSLNFKRWHLLDILNLAGGGGGGGGGCYISLTCTLRKTSRTRTGVYMIYDTGNSEKQLTTNDDNVFKISIFGPIRE